MASNKRLDPKWLDVQRRTFNRRDSVGNVNKVESPQWYGRMKVNGKWKWFKLFTDKRASQQRWNEFVRQTEQRQAGVITSQMDAAQLPLSQHVTDYLEGLNRTVSAAHYRIASYMLHRFIELAGWKTLADINEQSAARVLNTLQAAGHTVAYANQYLTRIKAFINWCVPERLLANPLSKLKRGNAKKGVKRRARRPLAEHELSKLLATCPASRRLKYAFPAYTGLRRKELGQVRWGDLHLESVIPYLQLRAEYTKTGQPATLPLHPYLVQELQMLPQGMPETKLFSSLPEGETMLKDLTKADVTQTDGAGRRADYHALRHTFATRLDASGCSHATRRALMRHGTGDQTDGYTLARLSEMYEAVKRLPFPRQELTAGIATGTDGVVTQWTHTGHGPALNDINVMPSSETAKIAIQPENQGFIADRPSSARSDLIGAGNGDNVAKSSPRSSVG